MAQFKKFTVFTLTLWILSYHGTQGDGGPSTSVQYTTTIPASTPTTSGTSSDTTTSMSSPPPPLQPSTVPPSIYSWNYEGVLGEESGWWGMWFPTCNMPNQSPIDIDTSAVVEDLDSVLVVRPVNGRPIGLLDAIVSYNSSFNMVRCDFSAEELEMYIYWDDGTEVADEDLPAYKLDHYTFRFPSEHLIDGKKLSAELRYTFKPSNASVDDQEMISDVAPTSNRTVMLTFLIDTSPDGLSHGPLHFMLQNILRGYESAATRVRPYIPAVKSFYQYMGTDTTPPCGGNNEFFISTEILSVDTSTMHQFYEYGPMRLYYRLVKPLDGRVVREVSYRPEGLVPKFRTTPNPVKYVENREEFGYNSVALYYAVVMLACLCGVLAFACLFLLYERYTHQPPHNELWGDRSTQREVFGMEVRDAKGTMTSMCSRLEVGIALDGKDRDKEGCQSEDGEAVPDGRARALSSVSGVGSS